MELSGKGHDSRGVAREEELGGMSRGCRGRTAWSSGRGDKEEGFFTFGVGAIIREEEQRLD